MLLCHRNPNWCQFFIHTDVLQWVKKEATSSHLLTHQVSSLIMEIEHFGVKPLKMYVTPWRHTDITDDILKCKSANDWNLISHNEGWRSERKHLFGCSDHEEE